MLKRLIRISLGLLSTLCVAAAIGYARFESYLDQPLPVPAPVLLEIRPGSSMTQVSGQLADNVSLRYPRLFSLWARGKKYDTALKSGEYMIMPGMSPRSALAHLLSGQTVQYPVTFIEGNTVHQALNMLWSSQKLLPTLQGRSDEEILAALQVPYSHLEGIVYPDTYFYTAGTTDLSILKRATARLQSVLETEWESRDAALPYDSPYQALVLASIIEKESGLRSEREQIAGVFVRRLQTGMRLQSDPTVIYGMGDSYEGNIRRADLEAATPYNTYRIAGLPPTPIALAGRDAIHASLHPSADGALYFVARGDGGHQFSDTLEEHNAAVRQYLLSRPQ